MENASGMISTAVMVGEISATDCASSCGKPRAFTRRGGPADVTPGSVVVIVIGVGRLSQSGVPDTTDQRSGATFPRAPAVAGTMMEAQKEITSRRAKVLENWLGQLANWGWPAHAAAANRPRER